MRPNVDFNVFSIFPNQVFEQIGELLIHCKYGCMPSTSEEGKYEVNSAGKNLGKMLVLCKLQVFHLRLRWRELRLREKTPAPVENFKFQ